jgi:hypothetical protein
MQKSVALTPECQECEAVWLATDPDRWRAEYADDGPDQLLAFFCPECWQREFG